MLLLQTVLHFTSGSVYILEGSSKNVCLVIFSFFSFSYLFPFSFSLNFTLLIKNSTILKSFYFRPFRYWHISGDFFILR